MYNASYYTSLNLVHRLRDGAVDEELVTGSTTPKPTAVPARFHVKQAVSLVTTRQRAKDSFWQLTEDAHASGDFKLASKDPLWREKVLQSHAVLYKVASKPGDERRLRLQRVQPDQRETQ